MPGASKQKKNGTDGPSTTATETRSRANTANKITPQPRQICCKCKKDLLLPSEQERKEDNNTKNDEPILRCKGDGCRRKYHLSCTGLPIKCAMYRNAMARNDKVEFLCDFCDVEGSAKYLMEYFEEFRDLKDDYAGSDASFVEFLIDKAKMSSDGVQTDCSRSREERRRKKTEVDLHHIHRVLAAPLTDVPPDNTENATTNNRDQTTESPPSTTKNSTPGKLPSAATPSHPTANLPHKIDVSSLIGRPIRLYCPIDNRYHIGRIIDWKTSPENDFYARQDFSTASYLVRFRAGADGRKVALHHWMKLEEHALAVGVSLIWVRVGKGKFGWRPAQVMLRTALEMVPVREIHGDGSDPVLGFCLFFGEQFHSVLPLHKCVRFFSPFFRSLNVPDHHEVLATSMAIACMEYEEQRRIRSWHKLPITDEEILNRVVPPPSVEIPEGPCIY